VMCYGDFLFIFGGLDGQRKNDLFIISIENKSNLHDSQILAGNFSRMDTITTYASKEFTKNGKNLSVFNSQANINDPLSKKDESFIEPTKNNKDLNMLIDYYKLLNEQVTELSGRLKLEEQTK